MNALAVDARRDDPESGATRRSETKPTIVIVQQRRQRGYRAGGGMRMRENEKGESEHSGPSELCQIDTEMTGSVGGLMTWLGPVAARAARAGFGRSVAIYFFCN